MSSTKLTRQALIEQFFQEISRQSTWTVIYHQALAVKMGLSATDLKSSAILNETGPITAGEMAEMIGLSTGAVTGVIDRLEQAGLVRRDRDPHDRRRVVIVPIHNSAMAQQIGAMFEGLSQASVELLTQYSDQEFLVILDFIRNCTELMKAQVTKLRQVTPPHE